MLRASPLLKRARTLQELVFAKRVLLFGSRQVAWRCRDRFACETFPKYLSVPWDASVGEGYLLPDTRSREYGDENGLPNRKVSLKRWQKLLEKYMECELTYETDKLIAISGLVSIFKPLFDDECVAGFWLHTLPLALSWRTKDGTQANGGTAHRQNRYRAPMWSGAIWTANWSNRTLNLIIALSRTWWISLTYTSPPKVLQTIAFKDIWRRTPSFLGP
jgi:hypothetical protein